MKLKKLSLLVLVGLSGATIASNLPYKDIAETLGISEVNARVKMTRVKIKLKEIMSKMEQ